MALDFITAGIDLVKTVIDRFPDPAQKAAAQLQIAQIEQTGELAQLVADTDLAKGQLAINQAEASSGDAFTSRARPFIMWVCGFAFAYKFVLQPFLIFFMTICGSSINWHTLPVLDWSEMAPVLIMMLGGTAARTTEKIKGVA